MTDTTETNAFLAHFGVLGMHWGIRKNTASSAQNKKALTRTQKKLIISSGLTLAFLAANIPALRRIRAQRFIEKLETEIAHKEMRDILLRTPQISSGKVFVLHRLENGHFGT